MLSEVFYTGLYTSLIGFVLAISVQCYRSKCKKIKMGCIKIERDVEAEEELDIQQPRPNPINSPSNL